MPSSVSINGRLVKELREKKGLERRELAELVGITPHRIYLIESGRVNTTHRTRRKIALVFGKVPDDLANAKLVEISGG